MYIQMLSSGLLMLKTLERVWLAVYVHVFRLVKVVM